MRLNFKSYIEPLFFFLNLLLISCHVVSNGMYVLNDHSYSVLKSLLNMNYKYQKATYTCIDAQKKQQQKLTRQKQ